MIALHWLDTASPAEIFYVDSLPNSDSINLMNKLITWVGQEWMFENLGREAALANRVDQLPEKLQVCINLTIVLQDVQQQVFA